GLPPCSEAGSVEACCPELVPLLRVAPRDAVLSGEEPPLAGEDGGPGNSGPASTEEPAVPAGDFGDSIGGDTGLGGDDAVSTGEVGAPVGDTGGLVGDEGRLIGEGAVSMDPLGTPADDNGLPAAVVRGVSIDAGFKVIVRRWDIVPDGSDGILCGVPRVGPP